jgi:hypothetical protein
LPSKAPHKALTVLMAATRKGSADFELSKTQIIVTGVVLPQFVSRIAMTTAANRYSGFITLGEVNAYSHSHHLWCMGWTIVKRPYANDTLGGSRRKDCLTRACPHLFSEAIVGAFGAERGEPERGPECGPCTPQDERNSPGAKIYYVWTETRAMRASGIDSPVPDSRLLTGKTNRRRPAT